MAVVHRQDHGRCPTCGQPMTAFAGGPEAPRPGDFSLCAYCRVYLVVTESGVRLLSNREWLALSPEERAELAQVRETAPRLAEPKD